MQHVEKFSPTTSKAELINNALCSILHKEASAIHHLITHLPHEATVMVEKILSLQGRLIFTGNGKSGIIARKLAATFSSIGVPALFLHPADALHGDIGILQPHDICIILSKSGSGEEFASLAPLIRSLCSYSILLCCHKGHLFQQVDLAIVLPFEQEACDLNLVPTSSSTLMLAFGDAVALVTAQLRGFSKNDFARLHPAGALGKSLLLTTRSLMHPITDLPLLRLNTPFQDILFEISNGKLGVGMVIDDEHRLLGIITDGDLRRACNRGADVFSCIAHDIMSKNPKTIPPDCLAYDGLKLMRKFSITSLVVTQANNFVTGLLHIHDILKAGIKE